MRSDLVRSKESLTRIQSVSPREKISSVSDSYRKRVARVRLVSPKFTESGKESSSKKFLGSLVSRTPRFCNRIEDNLKDSQLTENKINKSFEVEFPSITKENRLDLCSRFDHRCRRSMSRMRSDAIVIRLSVHAVCRE